MAYILAAGFIGIRFVDSFFVLISVLTPEMEKRMEKTIGMRIKECRVKMGMTQEELAEALLTKKMAIEKYVAWKTRALFWRNGRAFKEPKANVQEPEGIENIEPSIKKVIDQMIGNFNK